VKKRKNHLGGGAAGMSTAHSKLAEGLTFALKPGIFQEEGSIAFD